MYFWTIIFPFMSRNSQNPANLVTSRKINTRLARHITLSYSRWSLRRKTRCCIRWRTCWLDRSWWLTGWLVSWSWCRTTICSAWWVDWSAACRRLPPPPRCHLADNKHNNVLHRIGYETLFHVCLHISDKWRPYAFGLIDIFACY